MSSIEQHLFNSYKISIRNLIQLRQIWAIFKDHRTSKRNFIAGICPYHTLLGGQYNYTVSRPGSPYCTRRGIF